MNFYYQHPIAVTDGKTTPRYAVTTEPEFTDDNGPHLVFVEINDDWQDFADAFTPTQARDLAAILLQAADAAERSE